MTTDEYVPSDALRLLAVGIADDQACGHCDGTCGVCREDAAALLARVRQDAHATAEHRAIRAEAQADIRGRAVVMYRDRARKAEARIEAIRALHNADGKRWTGFPRADEQVVYCTYCQERSPCTTIQTLDGEG